MKVVLVGLIIGLCAAATIGTTGYLIYGWNPGDIEQYKITQGIGGFFGWPTLLLGAAVLLLLINTPFPSFLVSIGALPLPMIVAIFYECYRNSTSHTLLPFEIIFLIIGSITLHLPSFFAKGIWTWLKASQNPGSAGR